MEGVSLALTIIGSVMTLLSVTIAIFTFYFNRKRETNSDGEWKGELKADLTHIKDGVDELKRDNKSIKDDVQILRERIVLVDAKADSAHDRLDRIERAREKTSK